MSFKTVFLAVGATAGRHRDRPRRRRSATRLGAHLALLALGIAPPPPASPYGVVSNDIWAGEIRDGQAEAQARAEAIEARLAATGALGLGRGAVHRPRHGGDAGRRASPATPT